MESRPLKLVENIYGSKVLSWIAPAMMGLALSAPAAATARDFTGKVVNVADGDTITVLTGTSQVRIRLANIDAPERSGQAFGEVSRRHLASLVAGRVVVVQENGRDQYGRVLGVVIADGRPANAEQVRAGMAWVYRRYNTDPGLLPLETQARQSRRGLWADSRPTPPWEWRQAKKGGAR